MRDVLENPPVAQKGMLIRRPPADVFQAFVDPAITTKFWFTKSSGKLAPGATVRWDWEMYGVGADVVVTELEPDRAIRFQWGRHDRRTTVRMRFEPFEGHTFLQITEEGFHGTADERVALALDSVGGFSLVLAAVKALLEHGIVLAVVADHAPKGL